MRNLSYYIRKTTAIVLASGMLAMTGCTDKGQDAGADVKSQNETNVQAKADGQGSDNKKNNSGQATEKSNTKETESVTEAQSSDNDTAEAESEKETQADTDASDKETIQESVEETAEEATQEVTQESVEETTDAPVEARPVYRVIPETEAQTETTSAAQTETAVQIPVQTEAQTEAQTEEVTSSNSSDKLVAPFGIAFLGDSITIGYQSGYSYADVVCEDLGCVKFNYGISGNTLASNGGEGFVERYKCINPDCKVIVVYGGSNDYYDNVELGSPDSTKKDEFYGGLKKLCAGLKESYPDANIVFLTPLPGEFGGMHNSSNNETGSSMWDYVDAMQKICAKYDIPVIDLYHNFDINADNYDTYTVDGLHPNEKGHDLIAKAVEKYIKSLM